MNASYVWEEAEKQGKKQQNLILDDEFHFFSLTTMLLFLHCRFTT